MSLQRLQSHSRITKSDDRNAIPNQKIPLQNQLCCFAVFEKTLPDFYPYEKVSSSL